MPATSQRHFADRLLAGVDAVGSSVCVGLDPVYEKLPGAVRASSAHPVDAIERFSLEVLEAIAGVVGVVKAQSACFERYGEQGVGALKRVLDAAHQRGFLTILDAKRGDISLSASHYAAFAFEAMNADALTVNMSLGIDTIQPYLDMSDASSRGRGLFALVRTSNSGAGALQSQRLADGRSVCEMLADEVAKAGEDRIGSSGYSDVGAVVAATAPDEASSLRERMPHQLILSPGFGAQGGAAETVRNLFNKDGSGAIITASRSVIYAFEDPADPHWAEAVRRAAVEFAHGF